MNVIYHLLSYLPTTIEFGFNHIFFNNISFNLIIEFKMLIVLKFIFIC